MSQMWNLWLLWPSVVFPSQRILSSSILPLQNQGILGALKHKSNFGFPSLCYTDSLDHTVVITLFPSLYCIYNQILLWLAQTWDCNRNSELQCHLYGVLTSFILCLDYCIQHSMGPEVLDEVCLLLEVFVETEWKLTLGGRGNDICT